MNNTYTDLTWSGIDHRDAPKYTDAYIASGKVNGRPMTEEECNALTDSDNKDELLTKHLHRP
jgi:hypothetical protein